jgi:hypothetical protein
VGDWDIEGVLSYRNRLFRLKGDCRFARAAAGWGVLNVAKMELEGLGSYEEVDLLGFDRESGTFHYFAITKTGSTRDHKGKWLSDDSITFVYEGMQKGTSYLEQIDLKIQNPNELKITEIL